MANQIGFHYGHSSFEQKHQLVIVRADFGAEVWLPRSSGDDE